MTRRPERRIAERHFPSEGLAGAPKEGPAPLIAPDGSVVVLVDEFSGRGYRAMRSADPRSGAWELLHEVALPPGARHGSVLPLTAIEVERLQAYVR